jgi:hypothetical protein
MRLVKGKTPDSQRSLGVESSDFGAEIVEMVRISKEVASLKPAATREGIFRDI